MSSIVKDRHMYTQEIVGLLLDSPATIHISDISLSNLRDTYYEKSGTLSIQSIVLCYFFSEAQEKQEQRDATINC